MPSFLEFVGENRAVQLFGVKLVGVNAVNGKKLLFSLFFVALIWILGRAISAIGQRIIGRDERRRFWVRQATHLIVFLLLIIGLCSIWFDDPTRLATAIGLVTAGLAFALQRVVTSFAGYFLILRGKTFNVGDRIVMGGVRGDVIELGFFQTSIMEMGQPPGEQGDTPSMWVRARQYTGRIVTVTNDKVFDNPVYNYTREFPYIWEEMQVPVPYGKDTPQAERILLDVVRKHTLRLDQLGDEALRELERRYFVERTGLEPRIYMRLTDNWIELSARFIVAEHGVREIKDKISRDLLTQFQSAGLELASGTYQIVGLPPIDVRVQNTPDQARRASA